MPPITVLIRGSALLNTTLGLQLLASVAAGLLVGIERGWWQRGEPDGMRVAGIRTFTLLGGAGGLAAVIARTLSPLIAAVVVTGLLVMLATAFLRAPVNLVRRDATTAVAAVVALLLGLLAGTGYPAAAVAGAAVATLVLATREQSHRFLQFLEPQEVQAMAVFAVISAAVLPFLPDRDLGPYDAWNPLELWLVVVIIVGFSIAGYLANRLVGERNGTIATAVIGGAYSSTAITASFATRLGEGQTAPLATGIAVASAVMYLRVWLLTAILAPASAPHLLLLLGPAAAIAALAAGIAWRLEASKGAGAAAVRGRPFQLLPALGFLVAVAVVAVFVRWAQSEFGSAGAAWSLFLAGSFDVDAAIVTLSTLPSGAVDPRVAGLALGGTVAVNMAFKIAVVLVNARPARGKGAALALFASLAVLLSTLAWRVLTL